MAFCGQCGTSLTEEAAFCPKCGAPVGGGSKASTPSDGIISDDGGLHVSPDAETASAQMPTARVDTVASNGGARPAQQAQPKKSHKRGGIIAAVVAVVVIAVGVGAGLWWKSDQDAKAAAQAEWERTHVSLVTQVPIEAPGFDGASTSIPIQIKGTDLDGNSVDDLQFLRPGATHVSTLPGSYSLVFPSGYFTGTGKVMKAPSSQIHIEVAVPASESTTDSNQSAASATAADAESGAAADTVSTESSGSTDTLSNAAVSDEGASKEEVSAESISNESIAAEEGADADSADSTATFTEVAPLDVTDEMIADIEKWTEQDPEDAGKSQALAQAATAAHEEAVAAEEARLAAEAEAARKQAELDTAYNANPSVVQAAPAQSSAPVDLTGRIEVHRGVEDAGSGLVDVVLLILPTEVTVTGTQYGDQASNTIALTGLDLSQFKALEGQTVTLNMALSVRATMSIATAKYTHILGSGASLVKTFG